MSEKVYCGEPYEDKRVAKNCHAVTLDNGVTLPYIELGAENSEIIVTGAPYFITAVKLLEELAKEYHVYGFIMRSAADKDEPGEVFDKDGDVFWTRQWGMDLYNATQKLGIEKFHYFGKCMAVMPGYWLLRNHPETLLSFSSVSQTMHCVDADADDWNRLQKEEGDKFVLHTMRKKEGFALKAQEIATIGMNPGMAAGSKANYFGSHAELNCDSREECMELLKNNEVPIFYLFPTDDILYADFLSANLWAFHNTKNSRTVLLQGERHLFEMDIPQGLGREILTFLDFLKNPLDD